MGIVINNIDVAMLTHFLIGMQFFKRKTRVVLCGIIVVHAANVLCFLEKKKKVHRKTT